jgi:hypothetical protein
MMSELSIALDSEEIEALRRYANNRSLPLSALVKDYLEYLLAGGEPVTPPAVEAPKAMELAELAQRGGSLDWLAEEPDLYTIEDGEPV